MSWQYLPHEKRESGEPPQCLGQRVEQRFHRPNGLISHVGDPESLPFDFPVAAVNLETIIFPDSFDKSRDINLSSVLHARERDRAEAFLGKKIEPVCADPIMH